MPIIALFGIAVLNGVVLVNAINQSKEGGMLTQEAVFVGAKVTPSADDCFYYRIRFNSHVASIWRWF